jgi:hypothetical protein
MKTIINTCILDIDPAINPVASVVLYRQIFYAPSFVQYPLVNMPHEHEIATAL